MLGITTVVLFLVVTVHVALSLRQLLEAFIYSPSDAAPGYSSLYWLNAGTPIAIVKGVLYDVSVRLATSLNRSALECSKM